MKYYRNLFFIEVLFFALGILYVMYTPLWIPADEERHFAYCEYIARNRQLAEFKPQFEENTVYMAFHPPLYYLLCSIFCPREGKLLEEEITVNEGPGNITLNYTKADANFLWHGNARAAYLLRVFSLVFGGITILLIYHAAQLLFPCEPFLVSAATLFVAMNPEFMHVSASVSNENLNTMLATATLCALLYYLQGPQRYSRAALIAVLLGCSLLTKISSLLLLPTTAFVFTVLLIKRKQSVIGPCLMILCVAIAIAGWWYVRNWVMYDDPLFVKTMATAHPWSLRYGPLTFYDIGVILGKSYVSFFGYFGGLKVRIPWAFLSFYGFIVLAGISGLLKFVITKSKGTFSHGVILWTLFIALLGGIGVFALFNLRNVGAYSGRYLFVVIAPITILIFYGLQAILPARCKKTGWITISGMLIVLNCATLIFVLKPGYAVPRVKAGIEQLLFNHPTVSIDKSSVGQSFISPLDNLCGLRILFSNENKGKTGTIKFFLQEKGFPGKNVVDLDIAVADIEDFSRYYCIFPPIKNSRGKEYAFYFVAQNNSPVAGVALWYEDSDQYPEGTMLINQQPASGDLFFSAYYFTGDKPQTEWEGKQVIGIKQGLYVDIWELQLYQERSKEFRKQTLTHEKLQRFEKAINNRKDRGAGKDSGHYKTARCMMLSRTFKKGVNWFF